MTNTQLAAVIAPSLYGKSTLAKRFPDSMHDIDVVIASDEALDERLHRERRLPHPDWKSINRDIRNLIVKRELKGVLLAHHPSLVPNGVPLLGRLSITPATWVAD